MANGLPTMRRWQRADISRAIRYGPDDRILRPDDRLEVMYAWSRIIGRTTAQPYSALGAMIYLARIRSLLYATSGIVAQGRR
jgi:hypothetical protein